MKGMGSRLMVGAKSGLAAALLLALAPVMAQEAGVTLHVPAQFDTIQGAIDAASQGDTVLVEPGIYKESIDFKGKKITVTSSQGPEVTIIDAKLKGSVVLMGSGETLQSVIDGFTLRNGKSVDSGGGIKVVASAATITNNIVVHNQACDGAGIGVLNGGAYIIGNTIKDNQRTLCEGGTGGGGIMISGHPPGQPTSRLIDNLVSDNIMTKGNGGGIVINGAEGALVRGNIILRNQARSGTPCSYGGGIFITNLSAPDVIQNVMSGNSAGCGGAMAYVASGASTKIVNNTFVGNLGTSGAAVYLDGNFDVYNNILKGELHSPAVFCATASAPVFVANDVYPKHNYGGVCPDMTGQNGNIAANAKFVSGKDFHLTQGSPAIDSGNDDAPQLPNTDIEGHPRIADGDGDGVKQVDMGAFEAQPPPPTTVSFTASAETRSEAYPSITLTAQLSKTLGSDVVVTLARSGSATAGDDYASPATLTIPAGSLTGSIDITPVDDALDEGTEQAIFDIESATHAIPGEVSRFTLDLVDNDPYPAVSFTAHSTSTPEASSPVLVTIQLSAVSGRDVTIPLTATGTATRGADFTMPDQVVIPAGMTSAQVSVGIINDTLDENGEGAALRIGHPVNAALGAILVETVYIADDDPFPTVSFVRSAQSVGEGAGQATVSAQLSVASGRDVTLQLSRSGTATGGDDYSAPSQIVIKAGNLIGVLKVSIVDDALAEGSEQVVFAIDSADFAKLGEVTQNALTIVDND
jgi:hypothetical protein